MVTAASLMFICISSIVAYAYYTPVTTLVLSINPSISIEASRWNKIIGSKALDSDGSLILNNIVLTNKSIDNGLELLVKEAKAENFINDKYINDKKIISIHIKSNKNISIEEKPSIVKEGNKDNNNNDHSSNYESQKTKNNSLNKFLKNFND
ncbi:anti-sigma-I factor RsgI family protein [Clostridium sp.]|uniref:anti-sigma-I factor RsgI family protein n=1 Tax=Clostridium sp. TaxID=1506 RepID=UPI003D6CC011